MIDLLPRRLVVAGVFSGATVVVAGLLYVMTTRSMTGSASLVVLAAGGIVGAVVVLRVPAHWLPALALALFAIIPSPLTPSGFTFRVTLWAAVLVVWVVRRALSPELWRAPIREWTSELVLTAPRAIAILSGFALLAWSTVVSLRSEYASAGISWMISIVVCVMLPLFVFDAQREAVLLRKTWVILAAVFGFYACIELVLQGSPLYGTVYEILGRESTQHWSLYRAEATFGHPLLAGTFFTVGAALGFGAWLQGSRRSDLICAIIAAAGVVGTVSRGPMAAVGIAIAVTLVAVAFMNPNRSLSRPGSIAVAGIIAAVGVLNFEPVTARNNNLDAAISADARDEGITVALQAADFSNWLGSGAGTSGITGRLFSEVVIENSFLQLLISVGIPGVVFFLIFVGALAASALSKKDVAPATALLGFLICLAGYNAIDAVRPSHLLLGFLVIICLNPVHVPEFSKGIRMRRQPRGARIFDAPVTARSGR